jgi:hypothetical protein
LNEGNIEKEYDEKMISALVELIGNLFTKNNLENDEFLIANTTVNGAVPIEIIIQAPKILNICQDADTIRYALKECKSIFISEDGIRSIIKPEQNTLILRDISSTTSVEDITSIFSNLLETDTDCPQAQSVRPDMNNTWYITFTTETDARVALETLRLRNTHFNDKPVRARLKTESLNKSYYTGNGAAPYRGDVGYNGQISPDFSPPPMLQGMPPNLFFPPGGYTMSPPSNFMPPMMQGNLLQSPNGLPMMGYPMMMGAPRPSMQQQWSPPNNNGDKNSYQKRNIELMKKNNPNEYNDLFSNQPHFRNNQNNNQRNNNNPRNQNNRGNQRVNNNGNYQQNNVFFQNQDPNIMMQQQHQYLNQGQQLGRGGHGNFNQRNQGYNNQYFQQYPGQQNQPRARNQHQQFNNRNKDQRMPYNDMYLNNESDNQGELKDSSRNNDIPLGDRIINGDDIQVNSTDINKSVDELNNNIARQGGVSLISNENNSNFDQKGDYQNNKLRKNNKKQDNDLVSSSVNTDRNNKNSDKKSNDIKSNDNNSDKNKRKDNKIDGKNRNSTDRKSSDKKDKNIKKDDKESSKPSVDFNFENDFPTFGVSPVGAPVSAWSNTASKNFISGYAAVAAIGTKGNYTESTTNNIVDNQVKEQIKSNNNNSDHSETNKLSKDVTHEINNQKKNQQQQVNIPVISNADTEVVEVSAPVVVPVVKSNNAQSYNNSPELAITFGAFDNTPAVTKEIVETSIVTKDNSYTDEASSPLSTTKVDEITQSSAWGNSKRSFLDVVRTAK